MWSQRLGALRQLKRHHALDPSEFLVFPEHDLTVLVVSKNACTSIKQALGATVGIEAPDIHAAAGWHTRRRWGMGIDIL